MKEISYTDLMNFFLISWVLDRGWYGFSETDLQDKPAAVPLLSVINVLQNLPKQINAYLVLSC